MRRMLAAGSVAALAADVPFGHLLRLDVVIDRVAAVAQGAGRALHVVVGVERGPPVSPLRDLIRTPGTVADIPLHRQRKIVVADLREVALLPQAAVDEGH